jgi:membrane-bound lytic murein transglycosylase B
MNNMLLKSFFTTFVLMFFLSFLPIFCFAQNFDKSDMGFEQWIADFRLEAARQGITAQTLDVALSNAEFLEKVIALDKKQPEQKNTLDEYLERTVTYFRIKTGRAELIKNHKLLDKIASNFQVQPEIIVALWGIETSYGKNVGNLIIINALATLAY